MIPDINKIIQDKVAIIGVDVGGTKIKTGLVSTNGVIIGEPVTLATGGNDEKEKVYGRIARSIISVIEESGIAIADVRGIGLGATGPLDIKSGTILECPALPTMYNFPLRERIGEEFQLPVTMDNDANALVLGESTWGAGKGYNIVLGYTLGTGVGCATVINNKLLQGENGMAGEIWLSPYKDGTAEEIISGIGVSNIYQKLTNQRKSAKEISQLAHEGNKHAIKTWKVFGRALGNVVSWGVNMVDPGIVVIGGSIANPMHFFCNSMDSVLKRHICPIPAGETQVVKAALGDNAGYIGAASLAMQNIMKR